MFAVLSFGQLEQMLDRGQRLVLIDLRPFHEYQKSHFSGAVNIPYDDFREEVIEPYRNLPVVLYCGHGGRSMRLARDLANIGFRVATIGSGIQYYHGKYLVFG